MNRLTDRFGRQHEYLRISVTDRCNLRCLYCMPREGVASKLKAELLTFDEIVRLAEIFIGLGVRKIRVTGGEPLVRKGIEELCAKLSQLPGLRQLALSTNGVMLKEKSAFLKGAGVQYLNISLDTLRPDRFVRITLRDDHHAVLSGIDKVLEEGFKAVKINVVVMKGVNDDELVDFVRYAAARALNVRFVEFMPFLGNGWVEAECVPYSEMLAIIAREFDLIPIQRHEDNRGPAKEFHVAGTSAVIGFITSISEPFCSSCNRLRLTSDGKLRICLFAREEYDLRRLLRAGAARDVIEDVIRAGVLLKREAHLETQELVTAQSRTMTAIGG